MCSLRIGSKDFTPGLGPQKICSPKNGEQSFHLQEWASESVLPRAVTLGLGPQKVCSPEWEVGIIPSKMSPKSHAPQEWGVKIMFPRNMEQELDSPRMGSRSGGWQKSWFQTTLDPVLDYRSHKNIKSLECRTFEDLLSVMKRHWSVFFS